MHPQVIDIEKAIRNSGSKFVRSLPRFVISLIRRLIHEDEMNAAIERSYNKTGIDFVNGLLEGWNVDLIVRNSNNIPQSGRFIFVANHPVGAMDSLAFLSMIAKPCPGVVSPSNELFNYIPQLRPVILGVNVFGRNTRETAEKLNALFESDIPVMIFPSGEVSRKKGGKIEDPDWQKSFITKAVAFRRDIIPVHISGRNSGLFYFIARFRKMLGIKLYIETVMLPREMMMQRNKTVELNIGKPVLWQTLTKDKTDAEWAAFVKQLVYSIPGNL